MSWLGPSPRTSGYHQLPDVVLWHIKIILDSLIMYAPLYPGVSVSVPNNNPRANTSFLPLYCIFHRWILSPFSIFFFHFCVCLCLNPTEWKDLCAKCHPQVAGTAIQQPKKCQPPSAGYYEFSQRSAEWLKRPGNYLPAAVLLLSHTLRTSRKKCFKWQQFSLAAATFNEKNYRVENEHGPATEHKKM